MHHKVQLAPHYDLDKIKYATDGPTYDRAAGLYEQNKVTKFKADHGGFFAVVLGTKPYDVFVSDRFHNRGNCNCYLGQEDTLCKHLIAVAIYAVKKGAPLADAERQYLRTPICSGELGTLSEDEMAALNQNLATALRYIKPYNGPSRTWFAYQNSLDEGCNRLSAIVSKLPISEQTANILVKLLLKLDKKLSSGGVDDSNGTIGNFISGCVEMLLEYSKLDPSCAKAFKKLQYQETAFGWEEPLVSLTEKS